MLATFVGIAAGGLALLLEAMPRAVFAAAAVVFLLTAFVCFGITSLESRGDPPFDPDAPAGEPPVPQSQVTFIYDPKDR